MNAASAFPLARQMAVVVLIAAPATSRGDTQSASVAISPRSSHHVHALVTSIVRENLPHQYENTKDWGQTKKMWDGLHIQRKGLRIKTKRRWKQANHGAWKRYSIRLLNPDEEFRILVQNVQPATTGGVQFDITCLAQLRLFGRYSQWRHDVQLFSLSAEADAKVRFTARCTLDIRFAAKKFPPTIVVDPRVLDAHLQLTQFRLRHVSKVGGEPAQQLGRGMKKILDDVLTKKRSRLIEKMNRRIDKHRDDFEYSLGGAVQSTWGRFLWGDSEPSNHQSR